MAASTSQSCFRFPALDHLASEIRLIELLPGDYDAPISGICHVRSLDDTSLHYETLSYAWKNYSDSNSTFHTIFIDSMAFGVSATLFEAMKRLRRSHGPRTLWIDTICINQTDDREKSQQVDMMRRVYSQCEQCAIWFGSLGSIPRELAQAALDTISWLAREESEPSWLQHSIQLTQIPSILKTFMTLPWWNRIWTVQEALLPRNATIYWGSCQISWSLLHCAAQNLLAGNYFSRSLPRALLENGALNDLSCALNGLRHSTTEKPLYLLWRWRIRGATDPRDKVYGLMGIRDNWGLASVSSCDYQMSVATLFSRITADLIRLNGDLEPLVGRRGEIAAHEDLPSWAIDWSGARDGHGISQFFEHAKRYRRLQYTADRGIYGVGDGLRMEDERTLILNGLCVDRIAVVERCDLSENHRADSALLASRTDRWGQLIADYQTWLTEHKGESTVRSNWLPAFLGVFTGKLIPEHPEHGDEGDDWLRNMLLPQRVFFTEQGRCGVGPLTLQPDHEVWVVGGCRFPLILDSHVSNSSIGYTGDKVRDFKFIGDCLIYGIMQGEAVQGRSHEQVEIRLH